MADEKIDQLIAKYLSYRDTMAEVQKVFDEQIKPLKDAMKGIETAIMDQHNQTGIKSFKTDAGTAYISQTDTVSVTDWDAVLAFVKDNDAYDMLARSVVKSAVQEYTERDNLLPPGVKVSSRMAVRFRKPTSK